MSFSTLRCPNCGNAEQIRKQQLGEDTVYFCPSCNSEFLERLAKREYEKLHSAIKSDIGSMIDEAMLTIKLEEYYNLRQMLCKYITQEYIDSRAIVGICTQILKSFPNDFLANFFLTANTTSPKEVADAINEIDEKENEASIGLILDFMIKSLREEYITPIAALLDRCGKILSPESKQRYLTAFEREAERVFEGIYSLKRNRDVFVAYSSADMPKVIELVDFIESNGFSCFVAFRNLQHGRDAVANYDKALKEAIDHCSIFMFVSSVNSRKYSCDAFDKEIMYVRDSEMEKHPECRSYEQIPAEYKKLRIEYRLDNIPTRATDLDLKEFFSGLTYVEDHDQLIDRLAECKRELRRSATSKQNSTEASDVGANNGLEKMEDELAKIRAELERNRKAEEEAKQKAEAEAEAKRKAEREAKQKAEAEAEAQRKAEEAEQQKRALSSRGFEVENGVLVKYYEQSGIVNVVVPAEIKRIGKEAFAKCERIV